MSSESCSRQNNLVVDGRDEVVLCTAGVKVALVTVKTLLRANALRRLDGTAYRFCPERDCDIVYFDRSANSIFNKRGLEVRVGQKESGDPIPVCYCFDITVSDLEKQIVATGKTDLPAMISAEVEAGHCACEIRNPQGACCLGRVMKTAESAPSSFQGR